MKFIPRDHKMARLWVEACAAGLRVDKQVAAAMYANLCGFKTWDLIVKAIGSQKPSIVDEECDEETVAERKEFYFDVLEGVFSLPEDHIDYLVEEMSPSSGKVPKRFQLEHEPKHSRSRGAMSGMFSTEFDLETINEGMQGILKMLAKQIPGLADIDPDELMDHMRVSRPVEPAAYYNFCDNMGWDIIDDTYDEEFEPCKPMFCLSASFGDVFVYASSLSKIPTDNDDELAEKLKMDVLMDAKQITDFPAVILFAGNFMTLHHNDKKFTCGGCLYKDGEWYDFLVNKNMDTVDKLFEAAESDVDLNDPDVKYADVGAFAILTFLCVANDVSTPQELGERRVMATGPKQGWGTVVVMP